MGTSHSAPEVMELEQSLPHDIDPSEYKSSEHRRESVESLPDGATGARLASAAYSDCSGARGGGSASGERGAAAIDDSSVRVVDDYLAGAAEDDLGRHGGPRQSEVFGIRRAWRRLLGRKPDPRPASACADAAGGITELQREAREAEERIAHAAPSAVRAVAARSLADMLAMGRDAAARAAAAEAAAAALREKLGEAEARAAAAEEAARAAESAVGTTEARRCALQKHLMNRVAEMLPYDTLRCATRDWSRDNMVGEGGFGPVYEAMLHGTAVAVKRCTQDDALAAAAGAAAGGLSGAMETEMRTLSRARHANVVALLGWSADGPEPCLVYELLEGGDLDERLRAARTGEAPPLSLRQRLSVLVGAARGLAFLHSTRTDDDVVQVHRDVKPSNILLDRFGNAKIGDFGLVKEIDGEVRSARGDTLGRSRTSQLARTRNLKGTPAYMPPEAFEGRVSAAFDVFSFGVVIAEVATGRPARQQPPAAARPPPTAEGSTDVSRATRRVTPVILKDLVSSATSMQDMCELLDIALGREGPAGVETGVALLSLARDCLNWDDSERPRMREVQARLEALARAHEALPEQFTDEELLSAAADVRVARSSGDGGGRPSGVDAEVGRCRLCQDVTELSTAFMPCGHRSCAACGAEDAGLTCCTLCTAPIERRVEVPRPRRTSRRGWLFG